MTEIVKANLANACLGQHGEEYAMVEVIRVEDRPLGCAKNEFLCNVVPAFQVSLQQTFVTTVDKYPSEFTGEIHPPRLFALGRSVLAAHVVVLHQDEAFGIVVISTELDVAPLNRHEFSAAQPCTHRHEQQGMVLGTNLLSGLEKLQNW